MARAAARTGGPDRSARRTAGPRCRATRRLAVALVRRAADEAHPTAGAAGQAACRRELRRRHRQTTEAAQTTRPAERGLGWQRADRGLHRQCAGKTLERRRQPVPPHCARCPPPVPRPPPAPPRRGPRLPAPKEAPAPASPAWKQAQILAPRIHTHARGSRACSVAARRPPCSAPWQTHSAWPTRAGRHARHQNAPLWTCQVRPCAAQAARGQSRPSACRRQSAACEEPRSAPNRAALTAAKSTRARLQARAPAVPPHQAVKRPHRLRPEARQRSRHARAASLR